MFRNIFWANQDSPPPLFDAVWCQLIIEFRSGWYIGTLLMYSKYNGFSEDIKDNGFHVVFQWCKIWTERYKNNCKVYLRWLHSWGYNASFDIYIVIHTYGVWQSTLHIKYIIYVILWHIVHAYIVQYGCQKKRWSLRNAANHLRYHTHFFLWPKT